MVHRRGKWLHFDIIQKETSIFNLPGLNELQNVKGKGHNLSQ